MKIPNSLVLDANEIRHLRPSQLAQITGIDASCFIAWSNHRALSERSLRRISRSLGVDQGDVLKAFELRREDTQAQRSARSKATKLIQFLEQEPA